MNSQVKSRLLLAFLGLALIGYFLLGKNAGESEARSGGAPASRSAEQPGEIGFNSTKVLSPEVLAVWEKWKEKERWADGMCKDRPEAFQKSLEEQPPPDLKFGDPILLRLVAPEEGEGLTYSNDRAPLRLKIDGEWTNEERYAYGRHADMVILNMAGRAEVGRLVRMRHDVEGETIAILPRLNYHEGRRWLIEGWVFLSAGELLGLSHEEDGKSEQVIKSHFYRYCIATRNLSTLVLPETVNPYQALAFHGVDIRTGTIKIADEDEKIYFVRHVRGGGG